MMSVAKEVPQDMNQCTLGERFENACVLLPTVLQVFLKCLTSVKANISSIYLCEAENTNRFILKDTEENE